MRYTGQNDLQRTETMREDRMVYKGQKKKDRGQTEWHGQSELQMRDRVSESQVNGKGHN